jgi:tripeptidyl-peptidase-1
MKFTVLILLLISLSCVYAAVDRVFAARNLPRNWIKLASNVEPMTQLKLRIALHPKDAQALEKSLLEVSTPGSKRFRQYLKKDEITAIVGRSDDEIASLGHFFHGRGLKVTSIHPNKDWIFIEGPASLIEEVFKCKLERFQHKEKKVNRIGKRFTPLYPSLCLFYQFLFFFS